MGKIPALKIVINTIIHHLNIQIVNLIISINRFQSASQPHDTLLTFPALSLVVNIDWKATADPVLKKTKDFACKTFLNLKTKKY